MSYFRLEEFIDVLKQLKKYKVDLKKIKMSDTIESLLADLGLSVSDTDIEINDHNNMIGKKMWTVKCVYRGTSKGRKPTAEQENELLELGISLGRKDTIQDFIDKLTKLKDNGIAVYPLYNSDTIGKLVERNLSTENYLQMLEKLGLNEDDKIGKKKSDIVEVYKGNRPGKQPTDEQVKALLELGIQLDDIEKKDVNKSRTEKGKSILEFIDILTRLREKGVEVERLTVYDTIGTLVAKTPEVDSQIINELKLDENVKIGRQRAYIVQVYRGQRRGIIPTQEQKDAMIDLGVQLEKTTKKAKQKKKKNKTSKEREKNGSKTRKKKTTKKAVKKPTEKNPKAKKTVDNKPKAKKIVEKKPKEKKSNKKIARKRKNEEKKTNTGSEFIKNIELLNKYGIDVSLILDKDTIEDVVIRSGKPVEIIGQLGLKQKYQIGRIRASLSLAYQGIGKGDKLTKTQAKKLLEYGLDLTENYSIRVFIETLSKLRENGVSLDNFSSLDTIETLAIKSEKNREWVESLGLNPDTKIGGKKISIRRGYHGKGCFRRPSQKQVDELLKLGISLEYENSIQTLIDTLKLLKEKRIDILRISINDTVMSLAQKFGVSAEELIDVEVGVDYQIGWKLHYLKKVYKKNKEKISKEQMTEITELGISIDEDRIDNFVKTMKRLHDIGVDVSKISTLDTIESLAQKSGVSVDTLRNASFNPKEHLGNKKRYIACAYRGMDGHKNKPNESQVQKLLELGISLERKEQISGIDMGKAGFGSGEEICEAAEQDLSRITEMVNGKGGK